MLVPLSGDETDRGHSTGNRNFEIVVVRNDLVPVSQFRIGLIDHFVQVTRTPHVTVGFDQPGIAKENL